MLTLTTATSLCLSFILLSTTVSAYATPGKAIQLPLTKRTTNNMSKRSSSSSAESFRLENQDRVEYLTEVYIGTPAQKFLVTIDTGSADTWVPSTYCKTSQCPYNKFETSKSSSFTSVALSFKIQYGTGAITGDYGKDNINLGSSQQTVHQQIFGIADTAEDNIISTTSKSNGILGLGFPGLSANKNASSNTPYVFNLVKQNLIPQPVFSVFLSSLYADTDDSELMIGGTNPTKYNGDITYVPVTRGKKDYTFWTVNMNKIGVNSTTVDDQKHTIMLDTGTTLSYLNKEMTTQIVKEVTQDNYKLDPSSKMFTVDCGLRDSNQTVDVSFDNNVQLKISVRDLILPMYSDQSPKEKTGTGCNFGITFDYNEAGTMVFGGSVLRSAYFVFDMEKKRVGIATAAGSTSKVATL